MEQRNNNENAATSKRSNERTIVCSWENCSKRLKHTISLKYHMLAHKNQKPFKCSYFNQSFRSRFHVKKYLTSQHGQQKPLFNCHQCKSSFKTKFGLSYHLLSNKNIVEIESEKLQKLIQPTNVTESTTHITKDDLSMIEKPETIIQGEQEEKVSSCIDNETEDETKRSELYPSSDETGRQPNNYDETQENADQVINSTTCVPQMKNLFESLQNVENNKTGFKTEPIKKDLITSYTSNQNLLLCHINRCKKRLRNQLRLREHLIFHKWIDVFKYKLYNSKETRMKNQEKLSPNSESKTGVKQYDCTWENCGKVFKTIGGFRYHMQIHNEEKPFKCSSCTECFRSKGNLQKHFSTNHEQEKLELKCHQCDASFETKKLLRIHSKTHEERSKTKLKNTEKGPFNCTWENCNKQYTHKSLLEYHMRIHTNEKPYLCSECDERFRSKGNLKRHTMVYHNPQRELFGCDQCMASFKTEVGLTNHLKKKHKNQNLSETSITNSQNTTESMPDDSINDIQKDHENESDNEEKSSSDGKHFDDNL